MPKRTYLRDGRAPVPKDPRTSAVMSRIRAKDTTPELIVRRALREGGFTGYRLHYAKAPGRPDMAFVGRRVAIFVHGCFWHGCPHCQPRRPRTHKDFWNAKLDRNRERDAEKTRALNEAGWKVFTLWECRVKRAVGRELAGVVRLLATQQRAAQFTSAARKGAGRSASRRPRKS